MGNSILNNIQTENTWIDVETLAKLKGITKRAVRISINKYEYKTENSRGGKTYKIKLSSLEEELQIKYIQEFYNDFRNNGSEIIELNNLNIKQEKIISEEQKNRLDPAFKNTSADQQFITLYNTGTLYSELYNITGKISVGSFTDGASC